jgi:hypothetical protein
MKPLLARSFVPGVIAVSAGLLDRFSADARRGRPRRRAATVVWLFLVGGLGLLGDDPGLAWIFYSLLAVGGALLLPAIASIGRRAFRLGPASFKTKVL